MTPLFLGSEPVRAASGKYKGLVILQQEQNDGLEMLRALSDSQRKQAVLSFSKTGNNNLTEAFKDNVIMDYAGLRANGLTNPARRRLRDLVHLYVSHMDDGHSRVKMDEVDRHLDNTWFTWISGTQPTPGSAFYYRLQSPMILIESDHQRPANLGRSLRPIPSSRPNSTFIVWYVRRTAMIMARISCGSTTSHIRT